MIFVEVGGGRAWRERHNARENSSLIKKKNVFLFVSVCSLGQLNVHFLSKTGIWAECEQEALIWRVPRDRPPLPSPGSVSDAMTQVRVKECLENLLRHKNQ